MAPPRRAPGSAPCCGRRRRLARARPRASQLQHPAARARLRMAAPAPVASCARSRSLSPPRRRLRWGSGVTTPRSLSAGWVGPAARRRGGAGRGDARLAGGRHHWAAVRRVDGGSGRRYVGVVGGIAFSHGAASAGGVASLASSRSRSSAIRRTSSHRLLQFSWELKSEAMARAARRQRAQLDRTKSGAHRAIRGPRFISGSNKANNA